MINTRILLVHNWTTEHGNLKADDNILKREQRMVVTTGEQ
jgi:hypothetical protein